LVINEEKRQIKRYIGEDGSGAFRVEKAETDQNISVTNLNPEIYTVTSGTNVLIELKGSGVPPGNSLEATVEDTVVAHIAPGYGFPEGYFENIGGLRKLKDGFGIGGNTEFPSVFRLETGENVLVNGKRTPVTFLTPADSVGLDAAEGYSLPEGKDFSVFENIDAGGGKYKLKGDQSVLGIFRAEFRLKSGDVCRTDYYFGGDGLVLPDSEHVWTHGNGYAISENVSVFEREAYNVTFRGGIRAIIDGVSHDFWEDTVLNLYNTQKIRVRPPVDDPLAEFAVYVPICAERFYDGEGTYYQVRGEAEFPSTTVVSYDFGFGGKKKIQYVHTGGEYTPIEAERENYVFEGWYFDPLFETKSDPVIAVTEPSYSLYAKWSEKKT
jgi:uncharacterized repeat protein (TIGR02543 family)